MLQFKIEQIAIALPSPASGTRALWSALGAAQWSEDEVHAKGTVHGAEAGNTANLSFNYDMAREGKLEFELLEYTAGKHWMEGVPLPAVSHFGMHVTEEELKVWDDFFAQRYIRPAQDVHTLQHMNPVIAGKRWYRYTIYGTRHLLGVDLKFIVRKDAP